MSSVEADAPSSNNAAPAEAVSEDDIEAPEMQSLEYINLTTHTGHFGSNPVKMNWGASTPEDRGPVIATVFFPSLIFVVNSF